MKITRIDDPTVIMSNPDSKHSYFAWPTVTTLQNGKIAVVASGFRLDHICPFGKMVISYSEDNGETYTLPAPVIDTPLDDRDGGILPFGKSSVIVTSFNNTAEMQRTYSQPSYSTVLKRNVSHSSYVHAYLDYVTKEDENKYLGSTFRISHDYGVTYGPIFKSPVTSPHGPIELLDGTVLWIGTVFSGNADVNAKHLEAHKVHPDGTTEYVGSIAPIPSDDIHFDFCEPHAIALPDGRILVHIRVEIPRKAFTTYQSESSDGGKTWTPPIPVLPVFGGSPPHLFRHSSGTLICSYGFRGNPFDNEPFGIKVMLSKDNGRTWDIDHSLYTNPGSADLGYPSTTELPDGSLITVFYARPKENEPAIIMQQKWRLEDET